MTFTLAGFDDGEGLRRFAFQCVDTDRSKSTVIVRADVSLARQHQIRLQELPLICLQLLESLSDEEFTEGITLTEDRMIAIQSAARSAAEKKVRKAPKRPPSPETGQAWRTTHT